MNFFTQELKKIADRSEYIRNAKFTGRACIFKLSNDVTGKLEFTTGIVAEHYNSLILKLFNKREGLIDTHIMEIGDIMGQKEIYCNVTSPYIWDTNPQPYWYEYEPTVKDFSAMTEAVDDYLSCFADIEMSESEDITLGQ